VTPRLVERGAVVGTAAFAVAAVVALAGVRSLVIAAILLDLVLFALGCIAFALTLVRAAGRSRTEELSIAGLFFLTGSAPAPVRRVLLGAFAVQVVVALSTPFVEQDLAFGVLVPTFGLGCTGLWAALAGTFPPRSSRVRARR
jgi:hypothetical protein